MPAPQGDTARPRKVTLKPPSTTTVAPVMYVLRGEHRNSTTSAISSGSAGRARGMRRPSTYTCRKCSVSSSLMPSTTDMAVRTKPGATLFTRMP